MDSAKLFETFFETIAAAGWRGVRLSALARAVDVPFSRFITHYPDARSIFAAWARQLDQTLLADTDPDITEELPRERLFDILIRRLEAASVHQPAFVRLQEDSQRDPCLALFFGCNITTSMRWMLDAVGLYDEKAALYLSTILYPRVVKTWLTDSGPDFPATMARLDKLLKNDEILWRLVKA